MKDKSKILYLGIGIFLAGTIFGSVGGIGIYDAFRPPIVIEKEVKVEVEKKDCPSCEKQFETMMRGEINFKEGDFWAEFGDKEIAVGPPISYIGKDGVDNNEKVAKYFSNYPTEYEGNKKITLNNVKKKYTTFVFESPGCQYCLSNMEYIRELRKKFSKDDMAIVIVNVGAMDKKMTNDGLKIVENSLKNISDDLHEVYFKLDPKEFIYVVLDPKTVNQWVQKFSIGPVPLTMIFDEHGKLILRYEGYITKENKHNINTIKHREEVIDSMSKSLKQN